MSLPPPRKLGLGGCGHLLSKVSSEKIPRSPSPEKVTCCFLHQSILDEGSENLRSLPLSKHSLSGEIQDLLQPSPKTLIPSASSQFSSKRSEAPTKKLPHATPETNCNLMCLSMETLQNFVPDNSKTRCGDLRKNAASTRETRCKDPPKHAAGTQTLQVPSRNTAGIPKIWYWYPTDSLRVPSNTLRVPLKTPRGTPKPFLETKVRDNCKNSLERVKILECPAIPLRPFPDRKSGRVGS